MSFYKRLKELRKEQRWSQSDCADVGEVSLSTQKNYERGSRAPDANYLIKLHEAGVDAAYIITGVRTSDPVRAMGVVLQLADYFDLSQLDAGRVADLTKYIYSSGSGFETMRAALEATGAKIRKPNTSD